MNYWRPLLVEQKSPENKDVKDKMKPLPQDKEKNVFQHFQL